MLYLHELPKTHIATYAASWLPILLLQDDQQCSWKENYHCRETLELHQRPLKGGTGCCSHSIQNVTTLYLRSLDLERQLNIAQQIPNDISLLL